MGPLRREVGPRDYHHEEHDAAVAVAHRPERAVCVQSNKGLIPSSLRGTAAADDTQIRCSLWSAADDAQVLEAAEALAGAAPAEDLLVGGALGLGFVQRLLADGLEHGVEDDGDR